MKHYKAEDVNILNIIYGVNIMQIYYIDANATVREKIVDLFWIAIMFIGFPFINIVEWIHWEIYGHGPRKQR